VDLLGHAGGCAGWVGRTPERRRRGAAFDVVV
jgi:hypothetical protein